MTRSGVKMSDRDSKLGSPSRFRLSPLQVRMALVVAILFALGACQKHLPQTPIDYDDDSADDDFFPDDDDDW